jgi:hypothetical protein
MATSTMPEFVKQGPAPYIFQIEDNHATRSRSVDPFIHRSLRSTTAIQNCTNSRKYKRGGIFHTARVKPYSYRKTLPSHKPSCQLAGSPLPVPDVPTIHPLRGHSACRMKTKKSIATPTLGGRRSCGSSERRRALDRRRRADGRLRPTVGPRPSPSTSPARARRRRAREVRSSELTTSSSD